MNLPPLRPPLVSLIAIVMGCLWQSSAPGEEFDLPYVKGSTTLAVLPDTQYYSQKYPQHFEAQTRWIAEHFRERNIAYTLHLGDIVQDDLPAEWEIARRCLGMLDGKVPYLLTPGNHDYSNDTRETRLSEYFPVENFADWPSFGGVMEQGVLDNNFHLFEMNDQKWIALGLEYGPRKKTMKWASRILEKHRDRRAIIVTHGYLFYDNQRYDHNKGKQRATPHGYAGDGADGEQLWNAVIRKHPNVMIAICGHVRTGGLGYRASEGDFGNTVHEMMANYQKMRGGGMGFMRLLEFHADGKTVQVRTFSPSTGQIRDSELEHFSFKLQGATRGDPRPFPPDSTKLRAAPIHRYSFSGRGGDQSEIADRIGDAAGRIVAPKDGVRLDGNGHLVIDSSDGADLVQLPAKLVAGRHAASMEIWVTPTAGNYDYALRPAEVKHSFKTGVQRIEVRERPE